MSDIEYPQLLADFVGHVLREQKRLAEKCLRQPGAAELVALGWRVELKQGFSEDLRRVYWGARLVPPQ